MLSVNFCSPHLIKIGKLCFHFSVILSTLFGINNAYSGQNSKIHVSSSLQTIRQVDILTGTDGGTMSNVKVLGVQSQTELKSFLAFDQAFTGGVRVASGDVNGDGVDDIITGAGPGAGPQVKVYNGIDGSLLADFFVTQPSVLSGIYVAAGDINGDGKADIIASLGSGVPPIVYGFSGADFSELFSFAVNNVGFYLGGLRVAAGDVNGDGRADVIVGAGQGIAPSITVFSGPDQIFLGSFLAFAENFTGGVFVASGDVDGDGHAEIIVSPDAGGTPQVNIFSGADFSLMRSFMAYSPSYLGGVRVAAGDFTGDGKADIITGPGANSLPIVNLFYGLTGQLFSNFMPYTNGYTGGVFVSGISRTPYYNLTITSDHGTVTKSPNQLNYLAGTQIQLTATPGRGYIFSNWSGDATGSTNPLTITMTDDKNITANFMVSPTYETKFRTAKYEDWAKALDVHGEQKPAVRKIDQSRFLFKLVAPGSNVLNLIFSTNCSGVITNHSETLATFTNVKTMSKTLPLTSGDTLSIQGIAGTGKTMKTKYSWGTGVKANIVVVLQSSVPEKPMPNLNNVLFELFPKGFGQSKGSEYFSSTKGVAVGNYSPIVKVQNPYVHSSLGDVLKRLISRKKVNKEIVDILDTSGVRCLDSINGKRVKSGKLSIPGPLKFQSKLFAEALTLKLNIGASATQKFPAGFGQLKYNDPSDPQNPFNNVLVTMISSYADSMFSCIPLVSKPTATLNDVYKVLRKVNIAFADSPYTIDTLSFATKTKFTGVKRLIDVPYLQLSQEMTPVIYAEDQSLGNDLPDEFALYQNYPNPFNPTTTMSFELAQSSIVTLKVYNVLGQEVVSVIENQELDAGVHEVQFNAADLSTGVYYYKIQAGAFSDLKKMVIMK